MNKILLTGATGFVGSRFLNTADNPRSIKPTSLQSTPVTEIDFSEIDVVVHCAGIAHRMEPTPDELYFSVNRDLTLHLAQAAKAAGAKQFIFLSTLKVFGVDSSEEVITLNTPCRPNEPYGASKLAAEQGLLELEDKGFKVAIIRPPLIYGPGAKGNLKKLMEFVLSKKPVPLGGIGNSRSMIALDNLIHLIHCIIKKNASGIYLPSDVSASTTRLVQEMINNLNPGKKILTTPKVARWLIKIIKPAFHQRLFGSLEVGALELQAEVGNEPQVTFEESVEAMAASFKQGQK